MLWLLSDEASYVRSYPPGSWWPLVWPSWQVLRNCAPRVVLGLRSTATRNPQLFAERSAGQLEKELAVVERGQEQDSRAAPLVGKLEGSAWGAVGSPQLLSVPVPIV